MGIVRQSLGEPRPVADVRPPGPAEALASSAASALGGEGQEVFQVVPHDLALVVGVEFGELGADVLVGIGQALAVGEVGSEDDGLDTDFVDYAGDVLLGVRGNDEVLAEDLGRSLVEAAGGGPSWLCGP